MATITNYGRGNGQTAKGRKPLPLDPSCQPCPDCGGLECLCRPRFFAGQLLSEQDLNRLDHYIVEKHKLHNRHLWGSGVVCGLEVKCAPCDSGFVTVTSGYALSPCGEDIVVCKPDTVDICALIARCRRDEEPDCAPYRGQDSCGDVIEDWILAIRYAESPSRGVTALTGAGQGCGCSCAGPCTGACKCGTCGGTSCSCGAAKGLAEPEKPTQPRLNRGAPPSCEPTLTCETYRYDVFRAPEPPKRDPEGDRTGFSGIFAQLEGEMMARITCCLKELEASLPKAPGNAAQPIPANMQNTWFQWGCQMRNALANYLVRTGGHDCEAMAKLSAIVVPSPTQDLNAFQQAMQITEVLFALLVFEAIVACICSNALPPCPSPGDPRVPLALVRVRRRACQVVSVCNWHSIRKHVLTFPTLAYWFGFIPIARLLRQAMHFMCCELFGLREFFDQFKPQTNTVGVSAQPAASQPVHVAFAMNNAISLDPMAGFRLDTGLFEAVAARQFTSGGVATWADLANAALGRESVAIDPNLTGKEREAALQRVAASGPLSVLAGAFSTVTPVALGALSGAADSSAIAEMKQRMTVLTSEVEALKAAIGDSPGTTPGGTRARRGRQK